MIGVMAPEVAADARARIAQPEPPVAWADVLALDPVTIVLLQAAEAVAIRAAREWMEAAA